MTHTTFAPRPSPQLVVGPFNFLCLRLDGPPTDRLTIASKDTLTIQNATMTARLYRHGATDVVCMLPAARVTVVQNLLPGDYTVHSPAWPGTPYVFSVI